MVKGGVHGDLDDETEYEHTRREPRVDEYRRRAALDTLVTIQMIFGERRVAEACGC